MTGRKIAAAFLVAASLWASAPTAYADTTSFTTVLAQLEQMYQLPSGVLAKIANAESGGNPTAGCGADNEASRACGLFQWIARYWQDAAHAVYGQYVDPAERANPTVAAKVTAYTLAVAKNKIGGLIQQANIDMSLGLYLSHFLGIGGATKFLQAYIQDQNQISGSLFPTESAANPSLLGSRTLAQTLNVLASRLNVAGVNVSLSGNFADTSGISYAYSNADLPLNGYQATPYQVQAPTTGAWSYPTTYTPSNSSLSLANQNASAQLTSSIPTNNGATVGAASALIIAQPQTAPIGSAISVAWSSVNMSTSTPCTVAQDGTTIATGNASSTIVSTTGHAQGTITFAFSCTSLAGQSVNQSASVTIY